MSKITITTAITLSGSSLENLKQVLRVTPNDEVITTVDESLIAGMVVTKDGKTIDLSVKKQLSEIARD